MSLCTPQDVSDVTGLESLSDDLVLRLIAKAERWIDKQLQREGLGITNDDRLREACTCYTAHLCVRRGLVDASNPSTMTIESSSIRRELEKLSLEFQEEAQSYVYEYLRARGQSDARILRVVSEFGERVGEYQTMDPTLENER
jgi:hypothetical protein